MIACTFKLLNLPGKSCSLQSGQLLYVHLTNEPLQQLPIAATQTLGRQIVSKSAGLQTIATSKVNCQENNDRSQDVCFYSTCHTFVCARPSFCCLYGDAAMPWATPRRPIYKECPPALTGTSFALLEPTSRAYYFTRAGAQTSAHTHTHTHTHTHRHTHTHTHTHTHRHTQAEHTRCRLQWLSSTQGHCKNTQLCSQTLQPQGGWKKWLQVNLIQR